MTREQILTFSREMTRRTLSGDVPAAPIEQRHLDRFNEHKRAREEQKIEAEQTDRKRLPAGT
jgi:hypothetical protein